MQKFFPYPKDENDEYYKKLQKQRNLERQIKATKRECMMFNATNDDEELMRSSLKLRNQQEQYANFCKNAGLEHNNDRTQVYGFDRTVSSKMSWEEKKSQLVLDNSAKSSIIKSERAQITYTPATNLEDAKKFARETLGLQLTDYDSVNINVANTINREITAIYNTFGNLNQNGILNGIKIISEKVDYVAAYFTDTKEICFKKNTVFSNISLKRMKQKSEKQYQLGFWSTDNTEQIIRHELGHAVMHMLTDPEQGNIFGNPKQKLKEISDLREQIKKNLGIEQWSINDSDAHMKSAGNIISYYALQTNGEFIAESVAEYMSGNPRETAKKVIEILLRKE